MVNGDIFVHSFRRQAAYSQDRQDRLPTELFRLPENGETCTVEDGYGMHRDP
jgi:hypothetical protein